VAKPVAAQPPEDNFWNSPDSTVDMIVHLYSVKPWSELCPTWRVESYQTLWSLMSWNYP